MEMVKWIFKVSFFFVVVECGGDARRAVAMTFVWRKRVDTVLPKGSLIEAVGWLLRP